MIHSKFQKATDKELAELKKLVPDMRRIVGQPTSDTPVAPKPIPNPKLGRPKVKFRLPESDPIFQEATLRSVEVTRDALMFDNPAQLIMALRPELKLAPWQFEESMRMAGYLETGKYDDPTIKASITDQTPYKCVLSCANGSGKDMVLIAGFAVWFATKHSRNRVVITSSSFEQLKGQTEVHIRDLCIRANKRFGPLFKFTQFHYVCPELGSEIKLFVTDEAKRAEGWHPYGDGEMAIIINEAKSVDEEIFKALNRCTGYSEWIEISSPGPRSGHMYRMAGNSIHHPYKAELGKFFFRRVTAYECPWISASHIENFIYEYGEDSAMTKSSIKAEFADLESDPVVVSEEVYDNCAKAKIDAVGNDIGIGLDLAAGGDEDACFVRVGNKVVSSFFFRQRDTNLATDLIDKHLSPWKNLPYVFNADNGGVGQTMIDNLKKLGWRISRRNNQSPAFNKREFLNLGAEMYFYVKRLIERKQIILPEVDKLRYQLTTRRYYGFDTTQGKFHLESKAEARAAGRPSPDRGDAFVLTFVSYKPSRTPILQDKPAVETLTTTQLLALYGGRNGYPPKQLPQTLSGTYTILTGKGY